MTGGPIPYDPGAAEHATRRDFGHGFGRPKANGKGEGDSAAPERAPIIFAHDLVAMPFEPQRWIVDGIIPLGEVTILTARGNTGKSLWCMQLQFTMSAGLDMHARTTAHGVSLGYYCEESRDRLTERAIDVAKSAGISLDAIDQAGMCSLRKERVKHLIRYDARLGTLEPTGMFLRIEEDIAHHQPQLVILDSRFLMFGGEQNWAEHVTFFMTLLSELADRYQIAIILVSHPSKGADSIGVAGSAAWYDACRSMVSLDPERAEDGFETGSGRCTLNVIKGNYVKGALPKLQLIRVGAAFDIDGEGVIAAVSSFADRVRDAKARIPAAIKERLAQGLVTTRANNSEDQDAKVLPRMIGHDVATMKAAIAELLRDRRLKLGNAGAAAGSKNHRTGYVVLDTEGTTDDDSPL